MDLGEATHEARGIQALGSVRLRGRRTQSQGAGESGASDNIARRGAPCAFMCGCKDNDTDPETGEPPMRWAYSDGSGRNCWYCERIWCGIFSGEKSDRQSYQHELATDKDALDRHHSERATFIERRTHGQKYMAYKRGAAHMCFGS